MLTLNALTIARGAKTLIEDIDLALYPRQTIGLIGSNGCGKTSLFSAILGDLETSADEINVSKGLRIVCLEQEITALELSALDYVLSGDAVLFKVLQQLQQAQDAEDYDTAAQCHTELHELNGYSAEARAAKILRGLGFEQSQLQLTVQSFSGGWRMRLNLAKSLFTPSDLLLLDEPTNHLDMEAIIWLEIFLKRYPGGIILVSHDQDFLDHTVTHIAHIERKRLKLYAGDYSAFETQRAEFIAQHNAQHRKQQAHIAHLSKFVERFRAKASKAKQAQSRVKALEKMQVLSAFYETSPFKFHFLKPAPMPSPMISIQNLDLGYPDHRVIKRANITIRAGQRIGILGINGAGKSTLIKSLCGEIPPLNGEIERPSKLVIGYFAQHQVDHLPLDTCALNLLMDMDKTKTEKQLMSYLGSFDFDRAQALAPLKHFSGGEKSRVALAMIIWQKPNLLLLDEPTNHLDLEIRQSLTLALQQYEGAMLLISHDRHLMRTLVDELYVIDDGQLEAFDGTVEDYQEIYS